MVWPVTSTLLITLSIMSKKLQDDSETVAHYHQQHTSPTYFQNKQKHLEVY